MGIDLPDSEYQRGCDPLTKSRDQDKGQPVREKTPNYQLMGGGGVVGAGVLMSICDSKACFLCELVYDNHI